MQLFCQKPLPVRSQTPRPAKYTILHLCQSGLAKNLPQITLQRSDRIYGLSTRIDGKHITANRNSRKMLYHLLSTTVMIFFWNFRSCSLFSYPHFATLQTRLFDTTSTKRCQAPMRCYIPPMAYKGQVQESEDVPYTKKRGV